MSNQAINAEANRLEPSALITMFVLDATILVPANVNGLFRFHAGTSIKGTDIVWQGNVYSNIPCEADGFEIKGTGTLPRPRIRFENIQGLFTELTLLYQDLVGAKLIRKRTFYSRLDAVNFSGNVNPTADPEAQVPDDIYYIKRKLNENKNIVEFELGSILDVEGTQFPNRTVTGNLCRWHYRDADCGMAEDYVFALDTNELVPSKAYGFRYFGQYDTTKTYVVGAVVWVSADAPNVKKFYYAVGTPSLGEDLTVSENWILDQTYTGVYDPFRTYNPGETCYRMIGDFREYYYNLISCRNVEPPASPFWATDRCSLTVAGCVIRFSEDERGLPIGTFPGTNLTPLSSVT